jgi:hypothetical protein
MREKAGRQSRSREKVKFFIKMIIKNWLLSSFGAKSGLNWGGGKVRAKCVLRGTARYRSAAGCGAKLLLESV